MFRKLFLLSENTKSTIDFVIVEQETAFVPTEKSIIRILIFEQQYDIIFWTLN